MSDLVARACQSSGKRFRARMVGLAAELSAGAQEAAVDLKRVELFSDVIESIHLGSLVVDDIQDGSFVRRGRPSLHSEFGVPLALNAGNWLYFSALKKLTESCSHSQTVSLVISAMLEAHEGQSIDLGVDIMKVERDDVSKVVAAAADKKTGALMEAAFGLGAVAVAGGDSNGAHIKAFQKFGRAWGVSLQSLDDLGSFQRSLLGHECKEKLFEDFRNRRASFVWTLATELLDSESEIVFRSFAQTLNVDDELVDVLRSSRFFERGFLKVQAMIDLALRDLSKSCSGERFIKNIEELKTISRDLEAAYGSFEGFKEFADQSKCERGSRLGESSRVQI